MLKYFFSLIILTLTYYSSNQKKIDSDLFNTPKNIKDDNPNFNNLKEWLYKLIIEIPNDIIKVETEGFVQDLVLYDITLDRLITTNPSIIDNKIGVTISIEKAAVDIIFLKILNLYNIFFKYLVIKKLMEHIIQFFQVRNFLLDIFQI